MTPNKSPKPVPFDVPQAWDSAVAVHIMSRRGSALDR